MNYKNFINIFTLVIAAIIVSDLPSPAPAMPDENLDKNHKSLNKGSLIDRSSPSPTPSEEK